MGQKEVFRGSCLVPFYPALTRSEVAEIVSALGPCIRHEQAPDRKFGLVSVALMAGNAQLYRRKRRYQ